MKRSKLSIVVATVDPWSNIRDLMKRGWEVWVSDKPVVWHIQSLGFFGACRMHFHTVRTIAGFRLQELSTI